MVAIDLRQMARRYWIVLSDSPPRVRDVKKALTKGRLLETARALGCTPETVTDAWPHLEVAGPSLAPVEHLTARTMRDGRGLNVDMLTPDRAADELGRTIEASAIAVVAIDIPRADPFSTIAGYAVAAKVAELAGAHVIDGGP